jgi:hypothetical protein
VTTAVLHHPRGDADCEDEPVALVIPRERLDQSVAQVIRVNGSLTQAEVEVLGKPSGVV